MRTESERRIDLARSLADTFPVAWQHEVAVSGSAARGYADAHSDLEVNVWVRTIPSEQEWRSWLRDVHAEHIPEHGLSVEIDESSWVTTRIDGIWIEIGWATKERWDEVLERALSTGGGSLTRDLAATMADAVVLHSDGWIDAWQRRLASYPVEVAREVVRDNTEVWSDPHVPGVRWALADRGELFPLALRLTWDMRNVLAVLFAINGVWEPDHKWARRNLDLLAVKPDRCAQRVNEVFTLADPHRGVRTCFELILDTLALVPPDVADVSAAIRSIQAGLADDPRGA